MKITRKGLVKIISEAIKEMGFIKSKLKLQMEQEDTIPGGLAQGKTLTDLVKKKKNGLRWLTKNIKTRNFTVPKSKSYVRLCTK